MSIGVDLTAVYIGNGDDYVLLKMSTRSDGVESGVSQRVFASGQQRAIIGYSSKEPYDLVCEEVSDADWDWLDRHTSSRVLYRDPTGLNAFVVIGNIQRSNKATFPDIAFGVNIQMFVQETV